MATKKKSKKSKKAGAKKGARKAPARSRKGARRGVTRAGKVRAGAPMSKIAAALNSLESRVDKLEVNDAATYGLLLGMANESRKRHGRKTISSLPGFVTPRLYRGGLGMGQQRRALGAG
jgi:hypothetical protein